jgi:polysaccharide chain length determinant protein (PEP-CTERM system associated)
MDANSRQMAEYLSLFFQRKLWLIGTFVVCALISITVAMLLPAVYRSEALVLIEEQEIPHSLVQSTVTGYAAQQIQVIQQRINTSANVSRIIKKFDLYSEDRDKKPLSDLVKRFSKNQIVEMINADVIDPQNGRAKRANIAFKVAFLDRSPHSAQKVANELVTMFLEENTKARASKASQTVAFITQEAKRLEVQISDKEAAIARFKLDNRGSLPELLNFNMGKAESLDSQLRMNRSEIARVKNQIQVLNLQLSADENFVAGSDLDQLRRELALMKQKYSDIHPDVVRLKREIQALRSVKVAGPAEASSSVKAIRGQIGLLEREVDRLENDFVILTSEREALDERIAKTHQVSQAYEELTRDYENTLASYKQLKSKQIAAGISENMEFESKAESLKLIEAPQTPFEPVSPNRIKIAVMGVGLSGFLAFVLVLLPELARPRVWGEPALTRIVGVQPLEVVPVMNQKLDEVRHRWWLVFAAVGVMLSIFIAIAVVHFSIMPLDIIWFKLVARIGL